MAHPALLGALALVGALFPPQSLGQEPPAPTRWALKSQRAATGSRATYSFSEKMDLDMTYLRLTLQEQATELKGNDRSIEQRSSWTFTDVVKGTSQGGPHRVSRSFAEVSGAVAITSHRDGPPKAAGHAQASSPLEGATVEFTSGLGGGKTAAYFTDGSEPAAIPDHPVTPVPSLEKLEADVSCSGLLPEGQSAAVGDTWAIDPGAFASALAPGGGLPHYYAAIQNERDPDHLALFGGFGASRDPGAPQGKAEGRLLGTTDQDGATVAIIHLSYDLELHRDPAEWMQTQSLPFKNALVGQTAKNARLDTGLKGQGTLLWDTTHHRLVSITLEADAKVELAFDFLFEVMGTEMGGDDHGKFEGRTKLELSATYGDG